MKRIKSLLVVLATASTMACHTAVTGVDTEPRPISATRQSASTAVAAPAADSKKSRTILVVALLAALVVAAVLVSGGSDGEGGY